MTPWRIADRDVAPQPVRRPVDTPAKSMIGREPSLGEIADDIREIRASQDRTWQALEEMRATIDRTYLRQDVYQAERRAADTRHDNIDKRVTQVEDRHTWVARTAIAALLLPVLVAVVVFALLNSGGAG